MRLRVEVVPVSALNLGILVSDEATGEPVEPMTVVARRDVVAGRNYVLDRWCSEPGVSRVLSGSIPPWARDSRALKESLKEPRT